LEGHVISGAHVVVHTKDAEADRAFFRDVLGLKSVDAGHGWLIFALPPGEAAFHPSEENGPDELYFMCENLKAEMAALAKKAVKFSDVQEARWGSLAKMRLSRRRRGWSLSIEASYRPRLDMRRLSN
jgi:catechol 2,3-dioxygenase-like lactoylglutathione lyase family enzyme